ncbi:MAG: SDR family NAD(P)-dependent oxidoreductase [Clostridia bacterium]|nr:SDR family NAD(P)-dependent oxidoreductase [Clostridia bacterium]
MKTILLIGAGGGMGSACARTFLNNGDRVLGLDRPGAAMPEGVTPLFADLTQPEQIESAFAAAKGSVDAIDAVVYAAGIYDADSLVEIDDARMHRIFDVNVFGAYRTIRTFLPLLKRNARVVLVTSELADLDPLPFTGLYGITKSTLDRYAFSLAMELQMLGMRVSTLRPGAVETGLLDNSVSRIKSFTERTKLYPGVAAKFLRVTQRVEAKAVSPERVARKIQAILANKRPRFSYSLNRNPLLRLYGVLPKRLKLFAIRTYLKAK